MHAEDYVMASSIWENIDLHKGSKFLSKIFDIEQSVTTNRMSQIAYCEREPASCLAAKGVAVRGSVGL